jgi:hypothetical protein
MKMRTKIAAALALGAAALTLSLPGVASAQTGAAPPPVTGAGLPPRPEDQVLIPPEVLFSAPAPLGRAWARALRAVLADMKKSVEQERLAVEKTVKAEKIVQTPHRAAVWSTLTIPRRVVVAQRPIARAAPLPIEPPTYAAGDTHGESGVLLGVAIELPWQVP